MGLSDRIVEALKVPFQGVEDKQRVLAESSGAPQRGLSLASDIKDRYGELQILHELSQTILASPDIQTTLSAALKTILATTDFDIGNIRLFDAAGRLTHSAFLGYHDEQNTHRYLAHVREGTAGIFAPRVIASKRRLIIEDVMAEEGLRAFKLEGVRSAILVPIATAEETLGIIAAGSRMRREIPPEKVRLLEAMGAQIGIALQKARLFDETQRTAQEQSALSAVTIAASRSLDVRDVLGDALDKVLEVTGRDGGTIRFKDDLTGNIALAAHRGFSPSEVNEIRQTSGRMAENVFATGKSSVLNDVKTSPTDASLLPDVCSLASIPIIAGHEVVGVLTVSAKRLMPFERREIEFLESIGHVIGVAVQNSRHYIESLRGQEVQKLLKELSQDITALDLGELFQKITDKVREFFKVDISDIRLLEDQGSRPSVAASGTDAGNVYQLGGIRGRTAWIVKHRRPLVIADAVIDRSIPTGEALSRLGIRGYAAAPLFGRSGGVIGILRALSFEPRKFSDTEIDLLQQLANGIAIALENARLFDETRAAYRETQVLHEIAQIVLGGLDLKTMAQRILNKAVELGSFDFGTVMMSDGKWREAIAHFGYRDGAGITRRYEIASSKHRRRSLRTKDWLVIEDVDQADGVRILHHEGIKSAVLLPIITEGENGGVLQLGSRTPRKFDSRELSLLKGIANLLGIGLQKARLFQETDQHAQEQATISAIAMAVSQSHEQEDLLRIALDKVLEATGRDRGYIRLRDPATGDLSLAAHKGVSPRYAEFLKTHRRREGKTERVVDTGEPLIINSDVEVGPESSRDGQKVIAWIPIKAGGRAIGVLNVASRRQAPFAAREVELLQAIGNVIGVALENARLFQESHQQQSIQTLLKELSQDITALDLDSLLKKLTDNVREFFKVDIADVRVIDRQEFNILGISGIDAERVRSGSKARRTASTWVAQHRKPLVVPNIREAENPPIGETARSLGIQGYLGVPLFGRSGEVIGILRALSYAPRQFMAAEIDLLQQIANGAAIAIENARLFEETKRRQEEQTAINAIAMATTMSMRVDELLNIALKKVLEVTGRERGSIKLKDPATGRIVLAAHRGISQQYADTIRSHFAPEEKASQIFESGEVVVVDDPEKNLFELNDREAGLRSLIWVPLKARGAVVGILNVSTPLSNPFTEREIELLKGVGNVIGIAVENARLFEETEQRGREQAALYAVTAAVGGSFDVDQTLVKGLDTVLDATGMDGGYIYLLDGHSHVMMKAHHGMSEAFIARIKRERIGAKTARIIATKEPLILENLPADHTGKFRGENVTAAALVPIIAKNTVVGMLVVCKKGHPNFPRVQIPLLVSIGHALGVALENGRLFQETDRHLRRLQALREIDQAISSTLDLDGVLKILLEKIDVTLPYASATIRLINRRTGLLEPVACRNLDEEEWKKEQAGRGIPKVVFTTKSPLVIRDVRSDARATDIEFYRKHDLISYVGVPLIVEDEIIGVLGFYTKEEHDFEPEEINFLETLAGQAAIAIQNSQLYEEARLREEQLEESNRMLAALHAAAAAASQSLDLERVLRSVIEKVTEIFNFGTTQIHIYDPARDELVLGGYFDADQHVNLTIRSFRMGEGVIGKVAAMGKAIVFEDIAKDDSYRKLSRTGRTGELGHRFFAVFPIRGKLKTHGTVAFTAIQPRRLSAGETKLIEALTDQLAIAIENSKLYDELKQKVDELQRANKVKDEFLSVMSHELRTPLNIVIGYASLMREGMLGPVNIEQDRALDKLVTRTHELLSMITGILYATSIEANEVRIDSIAFALGGLLDEIKRGYAAPLSKPVTLEWSYPTDLPMVSSDPDKIRWILQTLVDNGIKFTENGRVAVTARVVGRWMEFQVSDTGIGISEEKRALIFDKFRQADGSETRRYGGIGLGLYIAQSFTRLLGGTIEIESTPERGSTFTVKLPFGRVSDATVATRRSRSRQRIGRLN